MKHKKKKSGSGRNVWLVDTENVQGKWDAVLEECSKGDAIVFFLSPNVANLCNESLCTASRLGIRLEFLWCECGRPDAMDFQIMVELGRRSVTEPKAMFHILSGDGGFESVVGYMAERGVQVTRSAPGQATGTPHAEARSSDDGLEGDVRDMLVRNGFAAKAKQVKAIEHAILKARLARIPGNDLGCRIGQLYPDKKSRKAVTALMATLL